MSRLINVTSFSKLAYQETTVTTAVPLVINVDNIISVSVRSSATLPSGVTTILYAMPYNQMTYQIPLVVTETVAAVVTAANANAIAT